jgi:catechol 2,3-dioxygenase-like lactoylglutathione lyase family enzyme
MVTKLSHTSIFVTDQDKAFDFYVNKLGFKVHTDVKMENGFRWLTLNASDQPDLEIILFPVDGPNGFDDEVKSVQTFIGQGCNGCRRYVHTRLQGNL